MKGKMTQKSHVSPWSDIAYEVEKMSQSHGIVFYRTKQGIQICSVMGVTSLASCICLVEASIALESSTAAAVLLKERIKSGCDATIMSYAVMHRLM